jgi:hypothetical protein
MMDHYVVLENMLSNSHIAPFKLLQSCSLVLDLNAPGICVNYYLIAVPDVLLRMLIVTRVGSTTSWI